MGVSAWEACAKDDFTEMVRIPAGTFRMGTPRPEAERLAAIVSRPTLFLLQNMEYSCIHSASSLGALAPGQTGEAWLRLYFVESPLEEWHRRMRREMS